jgi:hypothetical protein
MDGIDLRLRIHKEGTLSNDAPFCNQPNVIINVSLKKHQLQSIHAMNILEQNHKRISENDYLITEIGVLSNKVGSGKSLCVLGLIAKNPRLPIQDFVTSHFGESVYVMNDRKYMRILGGNLIVVPNHLTPNWVDYLNKYTLFTHTLIKNGMFPLDWDNLANYDIVICGSKYYNLLKKTCPWMWSRVIFDEADSINIPACTKPNARFVWFVSSSLHNLMFCNGSYLTCDSRGILTRVVTKGINKQGYIKSTFKELESIEANTILPGIIIKMNDIYVNEHLNLPPVYEHIIRCKDPIYLKVLHDVVSDPVVSMLHGCDPTGALDHLGSPVDTKENIISYVCRSLHVQRNNCRLKINYLNTIETADTDTTMEAIHDKIRKTNDKIKEIEIKLKSIHTKVEQLSDCSSDSDSGVDKYCPICMEHDLKDLCLYTCCLNVFCKSCVHEMLTVHHSNFCPLCRGDLKYNDIIIRYNGVTNGIKNNQNKYEKVIEIIKEKNSVPDSRVLIFVWHDNTLAHLSHMLSSQHFTNVRILSGNTNTITRTVNSFNDGRLKVLLVNASLYGCGLNLIGATDVIFFQKRHIDLETQLVGRAYRLGRVHPLHMHRILHEHE